MRKSLTGLLLLASLSLAANYASAQHRRDPRSGVIEGTVETPSGKPASRAVVYLQPADGEAPHAAKTDADGHFIFKNLKQGIFELRAESPLLSSEWERDINLHPGGKASVTLRLKLPKPAPKPQD
jgi:hypothetical protein